MAIYLNGMATRLPPFEMGQEEVRQRAAQIFEGKYPQFDRLAKTFATAGIETRHSVVPIDWFHKPHGWADRNEAYLDGTKRLFLEAATGALKDADWAADQVDVVVTVSSTGVATPTLEAQVFGEMGFRGDVMRVPVFGLGCAGGVSGLSIARNLAAGQAGAKVLLVVVEACSVAFRADRLQKADIIATVLFGDGAAAVCLSDQANDRRAVVLRAGHQTLWPDTLPIMGWDVDDTGLGVVFDRSIPEFVTAEFGGAVDSALAASGLARGDVDRFVCHPGGAKVVAAIEDVLGLQAGVLDAERDVLRRAGNMSAPTVFFVMEQVLAAGASGTMMACALGPGFTASFLPFEVVK